MIDINTLTIEQKILQTKVARIKKGKKLPDKPGAAFFFGEIITEPDDAGLNELRGYVEEVYADADIPPLITSDFENGCGSMVKGLTQMPYLMGLGAANDAQLAYDYGKATALEARSVGANWSFSPVADLNINRRNPLVNVRAMTDDAGLAVRLLPQVVRGMQENGLAACAKHFPGDGLDYRDQHIVPTQNTLSFEDWKRMSGKVFKALIESGVDSIMAGHISLPSYQKERDDAFGKPYPATLSRELITGLLKGELGFNGVVVTDALGMGGFNCWYDTKEQAEIEAFRAGCDMMLWPSAQYVKNMKKAIESGYISMERLDDAVSRILALKEKRGLFCSGYKKFKPLTAEGEAFVKETQRKVSAKAVTLLRDRQKLLPIDTSKVKTVLLVPVVNHEPSIAVAEHLRDALAARGLTVLYMMQMQADEFQRLAEKADLILYAMFSRPFRPIGFLDYSGAEAFKLQESLNAGRRKTICVSFGSPYFFEQYFEHAETFVNAYSMLNTAVDAFVRAAFGESGFYDFSPVKLMETL